MSTRVVEYHDAAVPEHSLDVGERLVVERGVELRFGQIGAQRAAHLHRADRPAAQRAAAVVLEQLAQSHAEGDLDQTAAFDVARQLHRQRAARAAHAEVLIVLGAAIQDDRHRGEA